MRLNESKEEENAEESDVACKPSAPTLYKTSS